MVVKGIVETQIGKNGLTEGNLIWIENAFKTRDNVKIRLLKAAGHNKENIEKITDKILARLGKRYTARILGFVISIKKWRREIRQGRFD